MEKENNSNMTQDDIKNNTNNKETDDSSWSFWWTGIVSSFFAPMKMLVKLHYNIAVSEIKRDSERFFSGMFSFLFGLSFIITFCLLLNVLTIAALHEFCKMKFFYAILIVTGANLLFAIVAFVKSKRFFKKPFMEDTRKLINDTMKDIL